MTKETVQNYGVRLNATDFDVADADAPEYIVVPVAKIEDGMMVMVLAGGRGQLGYYEFDLEDGKYVGDVFGNSIVTGYGPGDGLRQLALPDEARDFVRDLNEVAAAANGRVSE